MTKSNAPRAYQPTIRLDVHTLDAITAPGVPATLRAGQWLMLTLTGDTTGPRGQWLGRTTSGAFVIRWQNAPTWTGTRRELEDTAALRAYARKHGSR